MLYLEMFVQLIFIARSLTWRLCPNVSILLKSILTACLKLQPISPHCLLPLALLISIPCSLNHTWIFHITYLFNILTKYCLSFLSCKLYKDRISSVLLIMCTKHLAQCLTLNIDSINVYWMNVKTGISNMTHYSMTL